MGRQRTIQKRKKARFWRWTFFWAILLCVAIFVTNIILTEVRPHNLWGMGYGIAATVFLAGVGGWAIRRRTMRLSSKWRLGYSQAWLYFHIYGGFVFLLLILMHSGFQIPNGTLTFVLWLLSIWTILSGMAGLGLQHWIPRVLASGLSVEVLYDRVPELIQELRHTAESVVEKAEEPIQAFYARSLKANFAAPRRRFIFFWDITGGIKARLERFNYLRGFLSDDGQLVLNELERLYKTKLEIDAHYTLQQPLRWWLFAHVPTSWVLLTLVVLHIFTVFYY